MIEARAISQQIAPVLADALRLIEEAEQTEERARDSEVSEAVLQTISSLHDAGELLGSTVRNLASYLANHRGVSVRRIADRAGASPSTVHRWVRTDAPIGTTPDAGE